MGFLSALAALIAQAATLESRVPFMHFFDGFRTSHELNTLTLLDDADIRAMIREELVWAHRARALSPCDCGSCCKHSRGNTTIP
ncbi:MAG: hypothetical protein B7Z27_02165 [Sphingobacteriia bacterium 32-37-4]|nr:MAG: hypothetical protein B7Z27_02165 [Sphingobacteriia bacterium 32-37-4]